MSDAMLLRPSDLLVVILGLASVVWIGFRVARQNNTSGAYFMAGGRIPGWAVGFSLMATLISSSSFLALPEFAYRHDWRFLGTCLAFPAALFFAWKWFMPFYRRSGFPSAYEYFERRFGLWIRLYVALGFILFAFLKMGIVLYGTSVAISTVSGFDVALVILFFGTIVILYTVIGGLEAVIWTDVIQGCALILGALVCLPIMLGEIPGGLETVLSDGIEAEKISLGINQWQWVHFGFLVIVLGNFFDYLRMTTTDQMFVQRYVATRSNHESGVMLGIAGIGGVFVWCIFTFIGTALWVYYTHLPDPRIDSLDALAIFPHFIVTQLPAGFAGIVFFGLIMAAMSTLDSSINSIAQTVTTDFYSRLFTRNANDQHLLSAGRLVSVVLGILMVTVALYIHHSRTHALQELQNILTAIFGSGLAGLFLLGFATRRARYLPVVAALILMLAGVIVWLVLARTVLEDQMPHPLWLAVFTNVFVYVAGYGISVLCPGVDRTDRANQQ